MDADHPKHVLKLENRVLLFKDTPQSSFRQERSTIDSKFTRPPHVQFSLNFLNSAKEISILIFRWSLIDLHQ